MAFAPINDDHAIAVVVFTCALSEQATYPSLAEVLTLADEFEDELPALGLPKTYNSDAQIDRDGAPYPGIEFSRVRPNGTPTWSVKVVGSEITIECTRYTRWAKVWDRAGHYLTSIMKILAKSQPDMKVRSLALQVRDSFNSQEKYDISELFSEDLLNRVDTVHKGDLWHVNQGWFENSVSSKKLQRMNLESIFQTNRFGREILAERVVNVVHYQSFLPDPLLSIVEFLPILDEVVVDMHLSNKGLLGSVLSDGILKQIGLKAENADNSASA